MFSTQIMVSRASGGSRRLGHANTAGARFQKVEEKRMTRSKRFSRYFAPGVLVACLVSLAGPCAAQEVDVPTNGRGSGSVIAPSGWVELITPIQQRVDLKFYGFYIGDVKAPSGQVDATFRVTNFLSITPSYLYYSVPSSGLNELSNLSRAFTSGIEERQFRIDGTVMFSFHKLEISDRNMYVRRFLQTDDINRYRNRIAVAHPLTIKNHTVKPFASYEAFYDQGSGWTKNRVWAGVTVPVARHVSFQPAYMWEGTNGIKDLNYLMLGLIFRPSSSR
jgi:hypothetical protein